MPSTTTGSDASAGLIVSEGTTVSQEGEGYIDTPGLYNDAQVAAWRRITAAVHAEGGRIVVQLWHVGRISNVALQPGGQAPVSSTARRANAKTFTRDGFVDVSAPRALATSEIPEVVASFRTAARNAIAAGFDGVEVHGANGYLIDQFLRDSVNDRNDSYGGSIANRTRLLHEVMAAIAAEIGGGRTGLRVSPVTPSNDAGQDSDPQALFEHALAGLAPLGLAFVEVVEGQTGGARDYAPFDYAALRRRFAGAWIVNNGYTRQCRLRRRRLRQRRTWSPSAGRSSATPTSCAACARVRRSARPTRRPSTPAASAATPITLRCRHARRDGATTGGPP